MARTLLTHAGEIANGERFEFGKNWQHFLQTLTPERIAAAERSLCEMLGETDLAGCRLLDIGSCRRYMRRSPGHSDLGRGHHIAARELKKVS